MAVTFSIFVILEGSVWLMANQCVPELSVTTEIDHFVFL